MDLDHFRLPADGKPWPAESRRLPRHKSGKWFLKGPIPGSWIARASRLPGKALHVGLALWYLAGVKKTREVKLTGAVLSKFGVLPDAGRRGLKRLEAAGLVTASRHPGRCPLVTIEDVPETGK